MKKAAIYVRVSTQEQAQEGFSIPEQTERLTKYCEAHGWTIGNIYTDPGFSGANTNRPALKCLFKDCERKRFDIVVVYKLDRLSRSQKDTLYIIEDVFLKNSISFISMNENFDTGSPFGRAMIGILSVFAQLEREQIKERMAMGREGRAKQGKWHGGGNVPIGYTSVDGNLIPDEYEAMQVRKVFSLALEGHSFIQITRMMAAAGYTHKYGAYKAGYVTVSKMLHNPIYIGMIKNGDDYVSGIHDPLIDQQTFDAVQKRLQQISDDYQKNHRKNQPVAYMLSGLCHCALCGSEYSGFYVGAKGYRKKYYRCKKRAYHWREKKETCTAPNIRVEQLDAAVIEEIRKIQTDPAYFEKVSKPQTSINNELQTLNNRFSEIQKRIQRTIKLYSLGNIEDDDIDDQMKQLYCERDSIQNEIDRLSGSQPDVDYIKEVLSLAVLEDMSTLELMQLCQTLIDHIIIKEDESIEIYWAF